MKSKKAMGVGLIGAFAASLCCITPIIAIVGGIGGISSTFSWMEPLRPYLIIITVFALGFAWYKHIQVSRNALECLCDDESKKSNFLNTRGFLLSVTILSAILLALPYYSQFLFAADESQLVQLNNGNLLEVEYEIEGMTCTACEIHVNKSAKMVEGVIFVESEYKTGIAKVNYDKSKTNSNKIIKSIEAETGYEIIKGTKKK